MQIRRLIYHESWHFSEAPTETYQITFRINFPSRHACLRRDKIGHAHMGLFYDGEAFLVILKLTEVICRSSLNWISSLL